MDDLVNGEMRGKVALVTGASSGIGLATARAFAEAGCAVALLDVDENAVGSAAVQLRSRRNEATAVRCDVSQENAVAAAIHETTSTFGHLDFAFNNAGMHVPVAETADASSDDFDRLITINLRGVWIEEIASAVLWLCSPGAGFMVGQIIVPDGGYTTR